MPTHKSSGLTLLKRPEPEPPAELVQRALELVFSNDLAEFANALDLARGFWRKFPKLVEAPRSHKLLRAVSAELSDECDLSEEVLQPNYRESLRPRAIEVARHWVQKEREQHEDTKFLGDLGIAG